MSDLLADLSLCESSQTNRILDHIFLCNGVCECGIFVFINKFLYKQKKRRHRIKIHFSFPAIAVELVVA